MQTTVPEVEGCYFIQIATVEGVSPSTAFWRNYNALVTCNPKEKYEIDSLENILCRISNYIYKREEFPYGTMSYKLLGEGEPSPGEELFCQ